MLLRAYEADELGADGYPPEWHKEIKHLTRALAGNRCIRCGHPYRTGQHPLELQLDEQGNEVYVSWSPCDGRCTHRGPMRFRVLTSGSEEWCYVENGFCPPYYRRKEARWRVLTVHHLDGDKANCRWWNLVSLCQRCHLTIQGKVRMHRPYDRPHTQWFQPYAAGFYAWKYLGEDLVREEVEARLEELLLLELRQDALFT